MSAEPFIAYEPPHGGQNLRIRRIAEVWERIARFLTTCTDADLTAPAWPKLTLYEPASSDPSEWFVPTLAAVQETFGPGRRRAWTAGVREDYCHEWNLTPADATRARRLLESGDPWPRMNIGPLDLWLSFSFRWTDTQSGSVLPGQEPERRAHPPQATSGLLLTLSSTSSVNLDGRFPFAEPSQAFVEYVARVAPFLPFPMLATRFRHWIPTRRPSQLGYTVRRIDPAVLRGVLP